MNNRLGSYLGRKLGVPVPRVNLDYKYISGIKHNNELGYVALERVIEYPFIHRNIKGTKKILDFGCTPSLIPLELALNGHSVVGVDLRIHPIKHKNFTFIHGDILKVDLPHYNFDVVYSISTLEHVGLTHYNDMRKHDNSFDESKIHSVLKILSAVLNPNGYMLITVPLGKPSLSWFYRTYSVKEFKDILRKEFVIQSEIHFKRLGLFDWKNCSANEIDSISQHIDDTYGYGFGSNAVSLFKLKLRLYL